MKAVRYRGHIIEAWNQPEGRGFGWAPCTEKQAEEFFIFDREGYRVEGHRTYKSLDAARAHIDQLPVREKGAKR